MEQSRQEVVEAAGFRIDFKGKSRSICIWRDVGCDQDWSEQPEEGRRFPMVGTSGIGLRGGGWGVGVGGWEQEIGFGHVQFELPGGQLEV